MIAEEASTLLAGVVTHLPDLWTKRHDSISEFTRVTRNDFLTLIENDLITVDYLPDVLDVAQTLVSGYFLSAVTLLVDVPEINIRGTLDQLSTSRDPIESILGSGSAAFKFIGTESYAHGLPALENRKGTALGLECFALEDPQRDVDEATLRQLKIKELRSKLEKEYSKEAVTNKTAQDVARLNEINQRMALANKQLEDNRLDRAERKTLEEKRDGLQQERNAKEQELKEQGINLQKLNLALQQEKFEYEKSQQKDTGSVGFGRDALATIDELSNLSTGKTLEVNFERNGNRASVPVTIRLAVTDTDSTSMRSILSANAINQTFGERFRRVRNGELTMVKDLFLCHDIIAESRRARIRDKSGFYEHMMRHQSKNLLSGIFSLKPSINNASAVLVVSEETAKSASLELGGPFSKFSVREKVFKATAAMLIFVVDTKWDTVTIYHRGIDSSNTITSRDLQRKKGKGGGSQVSDIINAYQAGSAPII